MTSSRRHAEGLLFVVGCLLDSHVTVSRPKDVVPGCWRSYLGSDRGPETRLSLLRSPSRPGRGVRSRGSGCCEWWLYRTRHSVNNNNMYRLHCHARVAHHCGTSQARVASRGWDAESLAYK